MRKRNIEDFKSKILIMESGCWEWQGYISKKGYGRTKFLNKEWLAHRLFYTLIHGDIPDGKVIMHNCDNRKCVNPEHLVCGTQQQNIQDRNNKKRTAKGIKSGRAVLTEEEVIYIRNSDKRKPQLAKQFNVERSTIARIITKELWKHI